VTFTLREFRDDDSDAFVKILDARPERLGSAEVNASCVEALVLVTSLMVMSLDQGSING
jgi:hypothetical protein